jgi:hypothetical protein
MKIILSPTKKMKIDTDSYEIQGMPVFLQQTEGILEWLKSRSYEELKNLWKCNDKIVEQNVERLKHMELYRNLTPAILSYEGIAFQYMAPAVFEKGQMDYIQEHLRILSAFYGVLKPMDGITPYRLEMQAKVSLEGKRDLYELWGEKIYREVTSDSDIIINLASREYSRCVEPYLKPQDTFITVNFGEMDRGKFVTKATYAKMARGEMVRYMAEERIEKPEEMKHFDRLGYVFREDMSDRTNYFFERTDEQAIIRK